MEWWKKAPPNWRLIKRIRNVPGETNPTKGALPGTNPGKLKE